MTIVSIIERQRGCKDEIILLPQGAFYHAYEDGAKNLTSVMGYKLRSATIRKSHLSYVFCGFPISAIDKVLTRLAIMYKNCMISIEEYGIAAIIKIDSL